MPITESSLSLSLDATPTATQMPLGLPLFSPLVAAVLFTLSGLAPPSFSADITFFPNCNRNFTCGSLRNISYPFTGGDRPDYCGPPQFRLTCRNSTYAELTDNSVTYRVLEINQTRKSLVLARSDLWNTTCPARFVNSTLNSTAFSYQVGNKGLTILYGCSPVANRSFYNQFRCAFSRGVNGSYAFYLVGPVPIDPILQIITKCRVTMSVLVASDAAAGLTGNRTTLAETLMKGFNVNYSDPYAAHCLNCMSSGGQCGFNPNSSDPICICRDRTCPVHLTAEGSNKGSPLGWRIAIGFATSVPGTIIVVIIIIQYHKGRCIISVKAAAFWRKESQDDKNIESFMRRYGSFTPKHYSYSDVEKMTNSFKDKLGQGGYGSVYKGKLSDGHLVAVKVLKETKGNGEEFINEVASISKTAHVNIVTLLGFCYERNRRALVYELMPNGSLDKFIHKDGASNTNCSLEWKTMYQIAIGIARGLEYLHRDCSMRIVHFDIKPQNILLDENFCPKISDFGLAKLCQVKESVISMLGARGTVGYIAPEVFSRTFGRVSHKSDVYSYGIMVLEMAGGRKNIEDSDQSSDYYFPYRIYENIKHCQDVRLEGVTTKEDHETARKMMLVGLWCIQANPSYRPSMSKVVEMLNGSLESLRIPPKPSLFSQRSTQDSSPSFLSIKFEGKQGEEKERGFSIEYSKSNDSPF